MASKTVPLPPIHVEPETREWLESVLLDGESLSQFIEGAVRSEALWRAEQMAAVERVTAAARDARAGVDLISKQDFLARMETRAAEARERIRAVVAARGPAAS